jgi:hypothetical protein
MGSRRRALVLLAALCASGAPAGELVVDLGRSEGVTFVGALDRWDRDGGPRKPVDPGAKIDRPEVTARAERLAGNRWAFHKLPAGRYDLVILAGERVRVEGFHYPPVAEFDRFLPPGSAAPEDARDAILRDVAQSRHYENKVAPLYLGGDEKQVRVLMQLVRDQPTSYDGEQGAPVATARHEVWQYTCRRGTWVKDRRAKVLDRVLMARSEFHRWTWVWEPLLGGIEVGDKPVKVSYELPRRFDRDKAHGWLPAE